MIERLVFIKDRFIPESQAKISIYDSGLMFSDVPFEMLRSFNKILFKLEEHLERLYNSIKYLHIPLKMTKKEMADNIHKTIEVNKEMFKEDDEYRPMINIYRGALSIYNGVIGIEKDPYMVISVFPLRWTIKGMGKLFDEGINAVIPSQRSIPARLLDPKIKSRSRIHLQMANIDTSQHKGNNNWALMTDEDGFITEGTGDNFFIVKDGVVITPEPRNILRGISRQYVFELCKIGDCIEKNIEPYDVVNADEAFMTGTPFCILPVTSLNGTKIGTGKMGEVTRALLNTWSKFVDVDIVNQIKNWNKQDGETASGPTPYKFED